MQTTPAMYKERFTSVRLFIQFLEYALAPFIAWQLAKRVRYALLNEASYPWVTVPLLLIACAWMLSIGYRSHNVVILLVAILAVAVLLFAALAKPWLRRAQQGLLRYPLQELPQRFTQLIKNDTPYRIVGVGFADDGHLHLRATATLWWPQTQQLNFAGTQCPHCVILPMLQSLEAQSPQDFKGIYKDYEHVVSQGKVPYFRVNLKKQKNIHHYMCITSPWHSAMPHLCDLHDGK